MSKQLDSNNASVFDLNDRVTFIAPNRKDRMTGKVVRVYNTRELYHVEGDDGWRYEVDLKFDQMKPEKSTDTIPQDTQENHS